MSIYSGFDLAKSLQEVKVADANQIKREQKILPSMRRNEFLNYQVQDLFNFLPSLSAGDLTFSLGDIVFTDQEIPSGDFGDLGGEKELVVFKFPGGAKTAQDLGSFSGDKEFKGLLIGPSAPYRFQQILAYRDLKTEVDLVYGSFKWTGIVKRCHGIAVNASRIEYKLCFEVMDENGLTAPPAPSPTPSQANNNALAQVNAALPASLNNPITGFQFPQTIQDSVNSFQQNLNQALLQNGNVITNLPPSTVTTLQSQIGGIQSQLQPLVASTDPVTASAALNLSSNLDSIGNLLEPSASTIGTYQLQNPDLFEVSSYSYGDPEYFMTLLNANGLLDPMPEGTYTINVPDSSALAVDPLVA